MDEKILKMLEEINCNLVAIKVNQSLILDKLNNNKSHDLGTIVDRICPTTTDTKISTDYATPKMALYNDNMKAYVYR